MQFRLLSFPAKKPTIRRAKEKRFWHMYVHATATSTGMVATWHESAIISTRPGNFDLPASCRKETAQSAQSRRGHMTPLNWAETCWKLRSERYARTRREIPPWLTAGFRANFTACLLSSEEGSESSHTTRLPRHCSSTIIRVTQKGSTAGNTRSEIVAWPHNILQSLDRFGSEMGIPLGCPCSPGCLAKDRFTRERGTDATCHATLLKV